MSLFQEILQKYWSYSDFRELQEDIITSLYEGKDTLGLMPTGGGKSLTFQVPVMALEGLCIVVTPLIALMKDQVDNLKNKGIKALAVYSGMSNDEIQTAYDNAIFGDFKFLYLSPERLNSPLFLKKLSLMKVCAVVVDEAHCISQWGYDFRPAYMQIASIRQLLPNTPFLALTATATPKVVNDIQERLSFKEKNVFKKSFERQNLVYLVRQVDSKESELLKILSKMQGSIMIYVRNRKKTKEIATLLQSNGFSADYFHAGLSHKEKQIKQDLWKNNEIPIIVCTNAFGMGIDKPDVRLVIHIDLPNSIEEYFQEAGRAGRDEKKSYALILTHKSDKSKLLKRIQDEFPEKEFIRKVYDSLSYYYQIAEGYGTDKYYQFQIGKFCKTYKYPILPTHNALKILSLAGYLDYQDIVDFKSQLMFLVTRQELYVHQLSDKIDAVIKTVLRLYTGVFADLVAIDEEEIASQNQMTRQEVYEALVYCTRIHLISYIPSSKVPLISYLIPRIESKYLNIKDEIYTNRKNMYTDRLKSMYDYVNQSIFCRSRVLLQYFGEQDIKDCGQCDICLERKKNVLHPSENIRNKIVSLLSENEYLMDDLLKQFEFVDHKNVTETLRLLADEQIVDIKFNEIKLTKNE